MYTHRCKTVSLTAQIERLVQAFFNMALTPDISFVSLIVHSGFAASRSFQNPYSQTLCITPFCNCCQSLFRTGHEHLTLHPQQDLSQRAKRKGSCSQGNRSEKQNGFHNECIFTENFLPAATPHITGNILLVSAWKEMISLVSGLRTVQNF